MSIKSTRAINSFEGTPASNRATHDRAAFEFLVSAHKRWLSDSDIYPQPKYEALLVSSSIRFNRREATWSGGNLADRFDMFNRLLS